MSASSKANKADAIEPGAPITITLMEEESIVGKCHETTPLQALKQFGYTDEDLNEIMAVVNDEPWEMNRPLEGDCDIFPAVCDDRFVDQLITLDLLASGALDIKP